MPATDTKLGTISVRGMVHGALNCMIWADESPKDWFMQQFVSQEELDAFAAEHQLRIIIQQKKDSQ